jgi:hypothetical protein
MKVVTIGVQSLAGAKARLAVAMGARGGRPPVR